MTHFCQSHSSTTTSNTMAPPILKCITKIEGEKYGFKWGNGFEMSFNEWIHHYNHEYIGCNIHKYVKNYTGKETMWSNPYQSHFTREEENELMNGFNSD